jgi:hypothetical protein
MRIAKQIVLQLRSEGAPPPVRAVVRKVKQCLVAIPTVSQPGQAGHFAFNTKVVYGWDKQQPEYCRPRAEARREHIEFRSLRGCEIAKPREKPRPLAAYPAATGRQARLCWVVALLKGVDERGVEIENFKNRPRLSARLHQFVGQEEPLCRCVRLLQFGQTRMRKMDVSQRIVAVPPTLSGAFDIAQH